MKRASEIITLNRDCEAIEIPDGTPIVIPYGTQVFLMHALGGHYTVRTDGGYLARIEAKDADAIGVIVSSDVGAIQKDSSSVPLEQLVWERLRTCYDPEIPVNIVDLGLIYACELKDLAGGGQSVNISMTLTAPGCGMSGVIKDDVEKKLMALSGVKAIDVQLVFDPPWAQERMSDAAKLQLNLM
jgi:probable FeS assembly SUF system protein SufT